MNPTVTSFISCINAHDVDGICARMTDDHVFIDSLGNRMSGKETMRQGWNGYFAWFPDYSLEIEDSLERGSTIMLFGKASGTYSVRGALSNENHWEIPAAWKAVVRDGLIAEWRVYADNSPVLEIMKRNS
jgi:ketosteroid isomerase-like protein